MLLNAALLPPCLLPLMPRLPPATIPPQHIGADCQLVVICGRNAKLVEKLKNKCVLGSECGGTHTRNALLGLPAVEGNTICR